MIKTNQIKPEYYFQEGCYITEYLNTADDENVSVARARVVAHSATRSHHLINTRERYVILQGQGIVTINGKRMDVKSGDIISIDAGVSQSIENPIAEELVFLVICTPRFTPECYVEEDSR